jgi:hypothetical protein
MLHLLVWPVLALFWIAAAWVMVEARHAFPGLLSVPWLLGCAFMLLLCLHLSHGVSSVFQTLGLRNERWRGRLDVLALAYAWIVALGFISIPLAVLTGVLK